MAALLLFVALLSGAAEDYESLFRKAAELSRQGKYEEAKQQYKAALALRPHAPEALSNLAVMEYATGSYREAWETAKQALAAQPGMPSAALIAGLSAIRCDRPGDAVLPLQEVLRSDPANRDALLGLASARVGIGNLASAAALYQQRTLRAPDDTEAWYGQAICYERMAEAASRDLSKMPGADFYSKRLLGEFLLARGDAQLAREAFGEAAQQSGTASREIEAQYQKARQLAERSRESFSRVVALSPESWQAHLFLGDVERQHRNFTAALDHYQKARRLQPQSPGPLLGMGTVHWELGEFDQARQDLREALRLNPGAWQATFELANMAVRRHNYTEAIPLLERFLEAQPDALAARADLGRAYLHLGQYQKAAEQLERAAAADRQGDIHFQLATVLRKLGRNQQADQVMRVSKQIREAELQREQRLKSQK